MNDVGKGTQRLFSINETCALASVSRVAFDTWLMRFGLFQERDGSKGRNKRAISFSDVLLVAAAKEWGAAGLPLRPFFTLVGSPIFNEAASDRSACVYLALDGERVRPAVEGDSLAIRLATGRIYRDVLRRGGKTRISLTSGADAEREEALSV